MAAHPHLDATNHRAGLILLGAFLASFLFIRLSTRLMRSPRVPWWPGSIQTDGIHIHHMVFGIIGMMVTGFLVIALGPPSPWMEILAGLFGIGVGLTVDEFALWLYVEDVYWAKEGRASTDAAIICAVCAGLVLVGFVPSYDHSSPLVLIVAVAEQLAWVGLVVAKGKARLAVIAFFVPLVAQVAAVRLARPHSWWARRFYVDAPPRRRRHLLPRRLRRGGPLKLAEATTRAARWDRRRDRWLDRIGGAPSIDRPRS
jgi:hypothetical protein